MPDPLDLFTPRPRRRLSIEERFAKWVSEQPEVYRFIRDLALSEVRGGEKQLGIAALFEIARWKWKHEGKDAEGWKVNNTFRALCARKLAAEEPELKNVFELRELRSA